MHSEHRFLSKRHMFTQWSTFKNSKAFLVPKKSNQIDKWAIAKQVTLSSSQVNTYFKKKKKKNK